MFSVVKYLAFRDCFTRTSDKMAKEHNFRWQKKLRNTRLWAHTRQHTSASRCTHATLYRLMVSEQKFMKKILRPKKDKICWRNLHIKEHYNVNSTLNVIRVILVESKEIRSSETAACVGGMRNSYNISVYQTLNESNLDRRRILRWIFRKWSAGRWTRTRSRS
jgi:hypothetical protein